MSWLQNHGVNVAVARASTPGSVSPTSSNPAPHASAASTPLPTSPVEDDAREFNGRDGEHMFGVPNEKYEPVLIDRMGRDLWNRVVANAEKSFDELDADGDFDDW